MKQEIFTLKPEASRLIHNSVIPYYQSHDAGMEFCSDVPVQVDSRYINFMGVSARVDLKFHPCDVATT